MKIAKRIFYILILAVGIHTIISACNNSSELDSLIIGIIITIIGTYKNHYLMKKIDKLDFIKSKKS